MRIGGRDPNGIARGLRTDEEGNLKTELTGSILGKDTGGNDKPVSVELDDKGRYVLRTFDAHPHSFDALTDTKKVSVKTNRIDKLSGQITMSAESTNETIGINCIESKTLRISTHDVNQFHDSFKDVRIKWYLNESLSRLVVVERVEGTEPGSREITSDGLKKRRNNIGFGTVSVKAPYCKVVFENKHDSSPFLMYYRIDLFA